MNAHELKVGCVVFHKIHRKNGTVESTPRAHSTAVRLKLEGNASASYYNIADVEFHGAQVVATPAPTTPDQPDEKFNGTPAKARAPLVSEPIRTNAYAGDLTLARLREMRRGIRDGLELLDERIAKIVAYDSVRDLLATVRFTGESDSRAEIAVQMLKVQALVKEAQAAAQRAEQAIAGKVSQ